MTPANVLLAIRNKQIMGELTPTQGTKLMIAYQAIVNRHAAYMTYDNHARALASEALAGAGVPSRDWDLDALAQNILETLGLVAECA